MVIKADERWLRRESFQAKILSPGGFDRFRNVHGDASRGGSAFGRVGPRVSDGKGEVVRGLANLQRTAARWQLGVGRTGSRKQQNRRERPGEIS